MRHGKRILAGCTGLLSGMPIQKISALTTFQRYREATVR
jgi:hypothetical protein